MPHKSIFPLLYCCCCCSVAKQVLILCDTMDCSAPGFTISRSSLKLMSIESMMPSNHLILCCPLLFPLSIFPSIRVFSNELAVCIKVATVLELQIQHHSFQWIFKIDFLKDWLVWSPCCPRDSQESSPAPQFDSINSSALSLLYGPTCIYIHDYWKNHSFDYSVHTDTQTKIHTHILEKQICSLCP